MLPALGNAGGGVAPHFTSWAWSRALRVGGKCRKPPRSPMKPLAEEADQRLICHARRPDASSQIGPANAGPAPAQRRSRPSSHRAAPDAACETPTRPTWCIREALKPIPRRHISRRGSTSQSLAAAERSLRLALHVIARGVSHISHSALRSHVFYREFRAVQRGVAQLSAMRGAQAANPSPMAHVTGALSYRRDVEMPGPTRGATYLVRSAVPDLQ